MAGAVSDCPPGLSAAHAYVLATSGTTGQPKLVAVTHATSAAVLGGLHTAVAVTAGERALHTAAFTFSSSIRQLLLPLGRGAAVHVLNQPGRFDPQHLLATATDLDVTMLDLTPSQLAAVTHWLEQGGMAPPQLRRLLVASETLTPRLLARWSTAAGTPHSVYHLYGQTELGGAVSALPLTGPECATSRADRPESELGETDQGATDRAGVHTPDDDGWWDRLPLARPAAPFTAILDDSGPAELLVGGLDPEDGYLTSAGLDRERYTATVAGQGPLFRTGDLFTRQADDTLAFYGRTDTEVKLLGVRVDTLHLEQRLVAVAGAEHAAAVVIDDPAGGAALCLAYTGTAGIDTAAAVTGKLGPGLPPPVLLRLDAMPMTSSGKIDRAAVRDAARHAVGSARAVPPPDDPVAALWYATIPSLPGATTGADQDFFAAGGNSLSMLGLLTAVHRRFGVRILPEQFHRRPTLAGLQDLVHRHAGADRVAVPVEALAGAGAAEDTVSNTVRGVGVSTVAASPLQRQLWIAEQLGDGSHPAPFWLSVDWQVPGHLDLDRLQRALRRIAGRYDVLRFGFHADGGTLLLNANAVGVDEFVVHRATTPAHDQIVATHWLGPLTRPGPLLHLGAVVDHDRTVVGLRIHHSVVDRGSVVTLLCQLADAYTTAAYTTAAGTTGSDRSACRSGSTAGPSFLMWARQLVDRTAADRTAAAAYWEQVLPRHADIPPALAGAPQIHRSSVTVDRLVAPAPATTAHATWLVAYHAALTAHRAPQPDLIGVDIDLREPGNEDLVGPCVTTLPVVLTDVGDPHAAMATLTRMLPHRYVPAADVIVRPPTGDPRQPLFRHHLVYQPQPYPDLRFDGREATYLHTPSGIATNTTTMYVRDGTAATTVDLAWDSRVLDSATAQAVLAATASAVALHGKTPS